MSTLIQFFCSSFLRSAKLIAVLPVVLLYSRKTSVDTVSNVLNTNWMSSSVSSRIATMRILGRGHFISISFKYRAHVMANLFCRHYQEIKWNKFSTYSSKFDEFQTILSPLTQFALKLKPPLDDYSGHFSKTNV